MTGPQSKSIGEQSYEQFAHRYAALADTKAHNACYERPATLSLLPEVRGKRVLDAGCGPGIYAEWLLDHGAEVVAFDVTPDFVEIARRRVGDRAEVRCANLEQPLDFAADASFDLVVCPLVLDYIEDWSPVFAEFDPELRPDSVLVFSCGHPAADFFKYWNTGSYFDIELYEMTWHGFGEPYPVVKVYRRPLGAIINPLLAAGFELEALLEPQPIEEFKKDKTQAHHYDELMREPGFLCVRARRAQREVPADEHGPG